MNVNIERITTKRFQTSDGKTFATAPQAAGHQAGIDYKILIEEVDAPQFKTSDGRTWEDERMAEQHQAMLTFGPVMDKYIKDNASVFAVQGAETRFRSLCSPFMGWLAGQGVDLAVIDIGAEEEAAAEPELKKAA
jgi:hypothetical protein